MKREAVCPDARSFPAAACHGLMPGGVVKAAHRRSRERLPLWHRSQLRVDATFVSPLPRPSIPAAPLPRLRPCRCWVCRKRHETHQTYPGPALDAAAWSLFCVGDYPPNRIFPCPFCICLISSAWEGPTRQLPELVPASNSCSSGTCPSRGASAGGSSRKEAA